MRKLLTLTVLFFCSFLLFASENSEAVNIPYSVDDYIPELFKDSELRLGGSFRLTGNGNSFKNDSAGGSRYLSESRDSQADLLSFSSNAFFRKRYITVSKWYDLRSTLDANINWAKSTSSNDYTATSLATSVTKYERTNSNLNPRITQQIDLGKYVSGEYMISVRSSLSYSYQEAISNKSTRFDQSTTITVNTATQVSSFYESTRPNDRKMVDLSGELLIGRGRTYDGVFAFTAISMIEELDRKHLLLKTPTESEMKELTELIYQNRLVHAIDFRIRKIEILDEIISYLQSNGIVATSNSITTPVISDVWDYFPSSSHNFGLMVRGGIGISHRIDNHQSSDKSTDRDLEETYDINNPTAITTVSDATYSSHRSDYNKNIKSMPYFTVIVSKSKPINNRLQLDLNAQVWMYFSHKDSSEFTNINYVGDSVTSSSSNHSITEYDNYTRFALSGILRYMFDNRTSASVSTAYSRSDFDRSITTTSISNGGTPAGDTVSTEKGGYNFRIDGNLQYRISIPTTITVNVSYTKNTLNLFSVSGGDYSFDGYNFSIGLIHHLF